MVEEFRSDITIETYSCHVDEESLEQQPHVVARVDLLHLHLGVDVAVVEEVDVGVLHFRDAVLVRHDPHDVVERQKRVTLDLRVHVLAFRAAGEQLHQVDVVLQWTVRVEAVALFTHQLDQRLERLLVVVEEEHVVAHVEQLQRKKESRCYTIASKYIIKGRSCMEE